MSVNSFNPHSGCEVGSIRSICELSSSRLREVMFLIQVTQQEGGGVSSLKPMLVGCSSHSASLLVHEAHTKS
jgi:hypothetical protein